MGLLREVLCYPGQSHLLANNDRGGWLFLFRVFFGKQIGAGRKLHSENLAYGEEYDRSGQLLRH
jgi:hypothetical protein